MKKQNNLSMENEATCSRCGKEIGVRLYDEDSFAYCQDCNFKITYVPPSIGERITEVMIEVSTLGVAFFICFGFVWLIMFLLSGF